MFLSLIQGCRKESQDFINQILEKKNIYSLKYGFCKQSLWKNATLNSRTLFSPQKGTCILLHGQPGCPETKVSLPRCPFVPGQEQVLISREKLLCPRTSCPVGNPITHTWNLARKSHTLWQHSRWYILGIANLASKLPLVMKMQFPLWMCSSIA